MSAPADQVHPTVVDPPAEVPTVVDPPAEVPTVVDPTAEVYEIMMEVPSSERQVKYKIKLKNQFLTVFRDKG
jgi:hypothetical protein